MYLIDTNIAIHLRDGNHAIVLRLLDLTVRPSLSILSLVELAGGANAGPTLAIERHDRVEAMTDRLTIVDFNRSIVDEYRRIIEQAGFSRPRIIDRLIAATAIVNGLALVTNNARDFRDIPGLRIEDWGDPAQ